MNYQKIYNQLIERSKNRILDSYCEKHHIIPKCLGGNNKKDNIAILTPEEHYVSHQLLVKIYPENKKLVYALHALLPSSEKHKRNNKLYGWIRRKISEAHKGKIGTMTGKKHSKETKKKMSDARIGRIFSEETCKKLSIANTGKPSKLKGRIKNPNRIVKSKTRTLGEKEIENLKSMTEKVKLKVEIFDVIYSSIREAAEAIGVHEETTRHRCHSKNFPEYKIIGDTRCRE